MFDADRAGFATVIVVTRVRCAYLRHDQEVHEMKRTLIAKVVAVLLALALASTAAGANPSSDSGGGVGGGLSGAGIGNY